MGDPPRVILLTFAGRQPNMELQVPLARRILADHPNVQYHMWNLARTRADALYLQTLGGKGTVFNQFYRSRKARFLDVYQFYADPQFEDCLFIKIDDDIVFMETRRFADFVAAVDANRGTVVSAKVINNGASTRTEPQLWAQFQKLGIPLLDVHISKAFAELAHEYFFAHHQELTGQPIQLMPTQDWVSINCIGYDWPTARLLAQHIGTPSPPLIAGRKWPPGTLLGDEGVVNTLPRSIFQGFTAAHLAFGAQWPTPELFASWRDRYATLGRNYLEEVVAA